MSDKSPATPNPWQHLRQLTPARIALGRAGTSLPTAAQLDFQFAHAQARDAVHLPFDHEGLCEELQGRGLDTLLLHSAAGRALIIALGVLGWLGLLAVCRQRIATVSGTPPAPAGWTPALMALGIAGFAVLGIVAVVLP